MGRHAEAGGHHEGALVARPVPRQAQERVVAEPVVRVPLLAAVAPPDSVRVSGLAYRGRRLRRAGERPHLVKNTAVDMHHLVGEQLEERPAILALLPARDAVDLDAAEQFGEVSRSSGTGFRFPALARPARRSWCKASSSRAQARRTPFSRSTLWPSKPYRFPSSDSRVIRYCMCQVSTCDGSGSKSVKRPSVTVRRCVDSAGASTVPEILASRVGSSRAAPKSSYSMVISRSTRASSLGRGRSPRCSRHARPSRRSRSAAR